MLTFRVKHSRQRNSKCKGPELGVRMRLKCVVKWDHRTEASVEVQS